MKLGFYGINIGVCVDPEAAIAVARAAEAAGFDSVWTAEHVVLPEPRTPEAPVPASTPLLDPAVALAHLASHTRTIRLATGIIILPQRNPAVLAKELASVDVLSRGRLIFGLGAGYIPKEFAACGVPFAGRGARTDEYIEALLALWTQERPHFEGRHIRLREIDAHPRPVQRPHPPIVVGGMSEGALRRAVRYGNGWYGFALDLAASAACLEGLRKAESRHPRSQSLGPLEISVTPPPLPVVDRDLARRYEDLGVQRLVLLPQGGTPDAMIRSIEQSAGVLL